MAATPIINTDIGCKDVRYCGNCRTEVKSLESYLFTPPIKRVYIYLYFKVLVRIGLVSWSVNSKKGNKNYRYLLTKLSVI